jgi:hypothetical protein
MSNLNFFTEKNDSLIFSGNYMEVYIPEYYIENNMARYLGNTIETFAIFNFKVFKDENKKDDSKLHTFSFPSPIILKPSSILTGQIGPEKDNDEKFLILKFFKGDIFINNLFMTKQSKNTEMFLNLLTNGKLPSTIPYEKILNLLVENLSINSVNLNVPSTILELIISEIYRDASDLSQPFRFKSNLAKSKYKTINLKNISNYNSTFTALTFEDIDYALVSSINKTRYNLKETISPVEKTIKY